VVGQHVAFTLGEGYRVERRAESTKVSGRPAIFGQCSYLFEVSSERYRVWETAVCIRTVHAELTVCLSDTSPELRSEFLQIRDSVGVWD
jgi:hypothetical protein